MDQDGNLYPELIALQRQLSMNRRAPSVPVVQLTAADAFANALDGSRLSHRQHPYRLIPSTAYPSRTPTYQPVTSMRSSSTRNSVNNHPQPIPPTPPRVRNGIAEGYIPYLTPADLARDPARLALLDRAFEIFSSQMEHMRSSYPTSAQSQNGYSSPQLPIPSTVPAPAPAPDQSHNSYSSSLHRIPHPPSPPTPSQSPLSFCSEDESSQSDDDLRDPVIDINTPPAISDLLLAAIEVKPFMLPGENRRPETFVTQFETYADLLRLNDEQKRVLFARYAYRDNDLRFKALKYDFTYEDAKTSFLDLVRNNVL
ncbi:uncharacterized protein LOC135837621 [Planococcus citri]|uniref:uncharacterized protein LOC135837621 n=1 Tax=Planococcus citri TaxID=170843 RepID=UPI0031F9D50F